MKKAIIFGVGGMSGKVLRRMSDVHDIIGFCDNDKRKHGRTIHGLPVLPPEALQSQSAGFDWDIIIISTISGVKHIRRQLTGTMGIPAEKIIEDPVHVVHNAARRNAVINARELLEVSGHIGSVAEVGVFQGEFAAVINEVFPESTLYLFDTFEGFHKDDILPADGMSSTAAGTFGMTSVDCVMEIMPNPSTCIIKKGRFPETAADVDDTFALVSLDTDLYLPILEGLKFFYPRMQKGGYIFVHDFFYTPCPGVKKAVTEYAASFDLHYAPLGDGCSIIIVK